MENRLEERIKKLEQRIDRLWAQVDGEGGLGLGAKVNILWNIHRMRLSAAFKLLLALLSTVLGAAITWYFTVN